MIAVYKTNRELPEVSLIIRGTPVLLERHLEDEEDVFEVGQDHLGGVLDQPAEVGAGTLLHQIAVVHHADHDLLQVGLHQSARVLHDEAHVLAQRPAGRGPD